MARVPPPPPIANQDPTFNRWLLELTAILNAGGGVDPTQIPGYEALQAQVATNTANIATNTANIAALTSGQTTIGIAIANLQSRVTVTENNIATLTARNQVYNGTTVPAAGLGVNGDWYYNTTGAVGLRLYIKIGGTWVAQAI